MSSSGYGNDDSEEEGVNGKLSLVGNITLFWGLFGFICGWLVFMSDGILPNDQTCRDVCGNQHYWHRRDLCSFFQFCLYFSLATVLGPLTVPLVLCFYFCKVRPQKAAWTRTRQAMNRLRRYSDHRMWHARGWLTMIRARHQRVLARPKGWLARLRKLKYSNETNIITNATRDEVAIGDQTASDIELLEAGRSKRNFVRAVVTVVEIEEEGLFRHIITYL